MRRPPEDTTYDAHQDAQNNDGQNNIANDITNKERWKRADKDNVQLGRLQNIILK